MFCLNTDTLVIIIAIKPFIMSGFFLTLQIGLDVNVDEENERVPMMGWNTCAFTITTMGNNNNIGNKCFKYKVWLI